MDHPDAPTDASTDAPTDARTHDEEHDDVGRPTDLIGAGPALVRLGAGMSWRVTSWAWRTGLSAGSRVLQAAVTGESVASVVTDAVQSGRRQARELLGLPADARMLPWVPGPGEVGSAAPDDARLRAHGAALLAASADVEYAESSHPAYERMLKQLAPDEARILRLLATQGPQPAVDVRSGGALHQELVALGLSMIGSHAGVRYVERVRPYLNNLERLGLVWFSREPVDDLVRYQVLEAQPDVTAALRDAGRGRTVRRSIHLTPFGEDFYRMCFTTTEAEA